MGSVTDILREGLFRPTVSAMPMAPVAEGQSRILSVVERPVSPTTPAAKLQVKSASDYHAEASGPAARASQRALLLAKSAQTGLEQLLSKVDQMKEVTAKGARVEGSDIERAFLRMDLADLYKEYNAIASSTIEGLTGGLSGRFTNPVQIERVGDPIAQQGYTTFALGSLSRPIGLNDQLRLKVGLNPESVYTATQNLYNALPQVTDPQWPNASTTAVSNVIQALQSPGNGVNIDVGGSTDERLWRDSGVALLEPGYPLQFYDDLLFFATRGYSQFLTVRGFLNVPDVSNQPKPGSLNVTFRPGDEPITLRSLADVRIQPLEVGKDAAAGIVFPSEGGVGYLSGADASTIPVTLTGGSGTGVSGYGDLKQGSFTSLVLPYRGFGYSPGDELSVSLADLVNYGYGFSATVSVGASGEIRSLAQSTGGERYLGGGSGDRVPVRFLQTQTIVDPTGIPSMVDVSNATGIASIRSGEVVSVNVVSGGSGYIELDGFGAPAYVTLQVDPANATQNLVLRVAEVGNGNTSGDAFIFDAVSRSLDAIVGKSFFGNAGTKASTAPTPDEFSSALKNLESLSTVLKRQKTQATAEVQRLDAQVAAFGGLKNDQIGQLPLESQTLVADNRSIKLTRMLSWADGFEYSTLSLLKAGQTQSERLRFEWSKGGSSSVG